MYIPAVRSASNAERSRVIDLITLSFAGCGLAHGATFVVDGLEGAAMWLPPGVGPDVEEMMRILDENANEQTTDILSVLEQMGGYHPSEACSYLPLIGVDPAWQGRGFGAQLLRHATTRCDADDPSPTLNRGRSSLSISSIA